MPRWSPSDLAQFLGRGLAATKVAGEFNESLPSEAALHDFILEECRRRGWLAFHGSMAHRTKRTVGEPDFVILTPGGRLLLVECKTSQGKLSPEQLAIACHARKLGHSIHVIRSQQEFRQLIATHENQVQAIRPVS